MQVYPIVIFSFAEPRPPSGAEIAEREMRKRVKRKADETAFQRALKARKEVSAVEPKRWL